LTPKRGAFTGCDVASSFAWARVIIGEVTAAAVLDFLQTVVRPVYRRAGWRLQRLLTDNGLPQKSRRQSFSELTTGQLISPRIAKRFHRRGITR